MRRRGRLRGRESHSIVRRLRQGCVMLAPAPSRMATALVLLGLSLPHGAAADVSYGYDPLGRVTTALYDNGLCIVYTYDANGNRTSQTNYAPPQTPPPLWGSPTSWGNFNWNSAPQWPVWGSGAVWGCFKWTPQ